VTERGSPDLYFADPLPPDRVGRGKGALALPFLKNGKYAQG